MEQETKTQITKYIETKEDETIIGSLSGLKDEVVSLVGEEEKEDDDNRGKLFDLLKNDKKLLEYAELKMDEDNLKLGDKVKMEMLELRLSVTCGYFKDFQTFLEQLKKGDDVRWSSENNARVTPGASYQNNPENPNDPMQREENKRHPGNVIESSILNKWRDNGEQIPEEKVQEVWNYINNGGTFYSPTKGNITWGKNNYKHVCSTGSYNVLWRLGFPKVSESLNVDLEGKILPKMGLNFIGTVDPDDPEKNGYKPQNGDTAVRPKFSRDSGHVTQHQATYINGSWVSDTIQNKMSCYGDRNEPKNVKIYRYTGEVNLA